MSEAVIFPEAEDDNTTVVLLRRSGLRFSGYASTGC